MSGKQKRAEGTLTSKVFEVLFSVTAAAGVAALCVWLLRTMVENMARIMGM